MKAFESDKIADSLKGFTLGYVRPAGMLNSYNNRLRVAQQLLGLTGFYQKGSKLIYTPFAKDEEQEEENRSGLVYKPMINNMQDDMFNFIYEGFKPSFPVEPVQVPTAAKPTATEETPAQQTTSIQDIDISGPTTSEIIEEETPQKEEIVVPETVATNPAPVEQPQRRPILIRPTIPSAQAPADNTRVTPTAVTPAQQAKKMGTIKYAKANMNVGNMGEFIEMARKNGVSFMVTSGYRPGAMAANGRPSHHGAGNAIDIVPIPGQTFEDILEQMRNAPELLA